MKRNFLDSAVAFLAPGVGLIRMKQRAAMEALQRRYEGAALGRRTGDWYAPGTGAVEEIERDRQWLVNRSRETVRNNGLGSNAIQRIVPNNVVGTGIIPAPKAVGVNGEATATTEKLNKKVKQLWEAWAGKTTCDYNDNLTLYGLQHLAARAIMESGDVLIRRVINRDKKDFPLEIQVLESDFIDTTKHSLIGETDGAYNRYGIRFNTKGKVTGYWLHVSHPGEAGTLDSKLVDAKDVIHIFDVLRPGQIRGVPLLASILIRLKDLKDYEDAELIKQKVAACFSAFVSTADLDADPNDRKDDLDRLEPGMISYLDPGETVQIATPPANTGYGEHTNNVKRTIASGIGISYETLATDYSQVNFSSARMGRMEMQANIEQWQWNMIIPKLDKLWQWFIDMCVLTGDLSDTVKIPVSWTPPRKPMIDPVKETQAKIMAMKAGLVSLQTVLREDGYQPEEVMEQMKQDEELAKKYGLVFESNFKNDPAYITAITPKPVKESKTPAK